MQSGHTLQGSVSSQCYSRLQSAAAVEFVDSVVVPYGHTVQGALRLKLTGTSLYDPAAEGRSGGWGMKEVGGESMAHGGLKTEGERFG